MRREERDEKREGERERERDCSPVSNVASNPASVLSMFVVTLMSRVPVVDSVSGGLVEPEYFAPPFRPTVPFSSE